MVNQISVYDTILSNIKKYANNYGINLSYLTFSYIINNEWWWDVLPDTRTDISKELYVLYHSILELGNLLEGRYHYRIMIYDYMEYDDYETNDKNPKNSPLLPIEYYSKYSKRELESMV